MTIRSLTPPERETVINTTDADNQVHIWTAQRPYITRLRRHPKVVQLATGYIGSTEWAQFSIPRDQWNPVSGVKRSRTLSDNEKKAAAKRLAQVRQARQAAEGT